MDIYGACKLNERTLIVHSVITALKFIVKFSSRVIADVLLYTFVPYIYRVFR